MIDRVNKKSGFSLVEVVVALVILGLAISGMLTAFVMSRRNVNFASRRIEALNLITERIENLRGKVGVSGITPGNNELGGGVYDPDPAPVSGDLATVFGGQRAYIIQDNVAGTDLKQVTVTVTWTEP